MIRRLFIWLAGLVRRPDPTPDELTAEAERQRDRDKWLADEARQTRQSAGTGPGI